ncbi:SDR family oxidoreductase [Methylobacillus arboreus]|uniref:SDR family oxidoreductase n=1 Tax=Methylobacillus arboreus TaxID=755170 RepID=UPI001E4209B1|nr:SDR family oxidoreductase [Methylobacillus arboreus]MCB5191476.1 SDR family oxidoreductase [Methylobacillus arboreus]
MEARATKTVLVLGANGFFGRHLVPALRQQGHDVIAGVRKLPAGHDPDVRYIETDFTQGKETRDWLPVLDGVEVVINAVGLLREHGSQTFRTVHEQTPIALFQACQQAGVGLVIQFSALGADEAAANAYHLSKKAADDALRALDMPAFILQPSLVFGPDGTSARLFTTLSSLPLLPLPGGGGQYVQPVHIRDVASLVQALVPLNPAGPITIPVVGPEAVTMHEYCAALRRQMELGRLRMLSVHRAVTGLAARIGQWLPSSLLTPDTLAMLERGNTAEADNMHFFLGRDATPVESFISPAEAEGFRAVALLGWLLPLLRFSIALVWIVTGVLSLGIYPVQESYALLAQVGLTGLAASIALYGAACMDIALGIATLLLRKRRLLWKLQIAVIVGYTLILSWFVPAFWLHPFGPLLKNLPMLALIFALLKLERDDGLPHR